jgi:hypothetical protein
MVNMLLAVILVGTIIMSRAKKILVVRLGGQGERQNWQGYKGTMLDGGTHFSGPAYPRLGPSRYWNRAPCDSRAQLVVATYTGETRANRRYSVYPSRSRTDPLSKKPSGRPERSKIESIF